MKNQFEEKLVVTITRYDLEQLREAGDVLDTWLDGYQAGGKSTLHLKRVANGIGQMLHSCSAYTTPERYEDMVLAAAGCQTTKAKAPAKRRRRKTTDG